MISVQEQKYTEGMVELTERIKQLRQKLLMTDPIICPERVGRNKGPAVTD